MLPLNVQDDAQAAAVEGLEIVLGTDNNDLIELFGAAWVWSGSGDDDVLGSSGEDWVRLTGVVSEYWWQTTVSGEVDIRDTVTARDGSNKLTNIEWLQFEDAQVDLTLAEYAARLEPKDLQRLCELYVGFFNRIPEAAGIRYWVDELQKGATLTEVADQFYAAGVSFGVYAADMTDAEFITGVYANVLGRTGADTPTAQEVGYWENWLQQSGNSKGSMVLTMLNDTHEQFSDDPEWGFVSDLLNNKFAMANHFALDGGITYRDPLLNIAVGQQLANAITPQGIEQAIAELGLPTQPPITSAPEPPVNTAPVLTGDAILDPVIEDTVRVISANELLAFASDNESDALSIVEFSLKDVASGKLEGGPDIGWTFTPTKNLNGTVQFSMTISDGEESTSDLVDLGITPVNDAPVISAEQTFVLLEDGRLEFSVDVIDIDDDQLSFSFAPPRHGSLMKLVESGGFRYVPYPSFVGEDKALVQVKDSAGATDLQEVFFVIEPRNNLPIAGDDLGSTDESSILQVSAANGLLTNDFDEDGDPLTISAVLGSAANLNTVVQGSTGGRFTVNSDGSYRFDPAGDFAYLLSGQTSTTQISYEVADGQGGRDTATLSVVVEGFHVDQPNSPVPPTEPDDESADPVGEPYNIDFRFLDIGAQQYASYFWDAATKLESVITEGLPDISYLGQSIDDLLIEVSVEPIDGEYGVLGSAGPDFWRPGTYLPYLGGMRFDSEDMAWMSAEGILDDVIVHEMLHVLGIGTLWDFAGLVSGNQYIGVNALNEYKTLSGDMAATGILLTTGVGPGSDYSHWDEDTFDNELMTPFINSGSNPLSRITVGALEDLGYSVNYAQADAYSPPALVALGLSGSNSDLADGYNLLMV